MQDETVLDPSTRKFPSDKRLLGMMQINGSYTL